MITISLGNIPLVFTEEDGHVRVSSPVRNALLGETNTEYVVDLVKENFQKVDSFYLSRIAGSEDLFRLEDIHSLAVSIVLYYLSMYNSWRIQYRRPRYDDLRFKEEDFEHPGTHDILFYFYKTSYPDDWEARCAILLGMELTALKAYYQRRLDYYNK